MYKSTSTSSNIINIQGCLLSGLPKELVDKISGYYGNTIPKDVSEQIKNQRILNSIKKFEYNLIPNTVLWDVSGLIIKLYSSGFITPTIYESIHKPMWKDADKRINKIWWSFSLSEQNQMIETHFSKYRSALQNNTMCHAYESEFITGREFMKSRVGYYLVDY